MAEQMTIGARLRALRHAWDVTVTQKQVAEALGVSTALLSSWETGAAVPPEDRLQAFARFFATRRSLATGVPVLIAAEELTVDEEQVRRQLVDELVALREGDATTRRAATGALGGRFWYFPDGQPVTVLYTPLSPAQLGADGDRPLPPATQYALNRLHPNAVTQLANGDVDALLELIGHIRAENPTTDVRWTTHDRAPADQLSGHVVILGGGDEGNWNGAELIAQLMQTLEIPVESRLGPGGDDEFDLEFVVSVDADDVPRFGSAKEEVYRPRFVRDESDPSRARVTHQGAPVLEADIALLVRRRNPFNLAASLTMLSGIFSRGTYGAVRAFTDALFRTRNEQWLAGGTRPDDFGMLVQVPVVAGETMTPDLGRASTRLRMLF